MLIFIDLDNTLLKTDKSISDYTISTLKEVSKLGHQIVLLTGRNINTSLYYYKKLGLNTLMSNLEGCIIWNPSNYTNILNNNDYQENKYQIDGLKFTFNANVIKHIFSNEYLLKHLLLSGNITTKHVYLVTHSVVDDTLKNELYDYLGLRTTPYYQADFSNVKIQDNINNVSDGYYGVLMVLENSLKAIEVIEYLKREYPTLNISYWVGRNSHLFVQITSFFATKKTAYRYICSYYGVAFKDTFVFGDALNDLMVLRKCKEHGGYAYAMSNALNVVKQNAAYITEFSNNEDGVAKTLAKHFLMKENENETSKRIT